MSPVRNSAILQCFDAVGWVTCKSSAAAIHISLLLVTGVWPNLKYPTLEWLWKSGLVKHKLRERVCVCVCVCMCVSVLTSLLFWHYKRHPAWKRILKKLWRFPYVDQIGVAWTWQIVPITVDWLMIDRLTDWLTCQLMLSICCVTALYVVCDHCCLSNAMYSIGQNIKLL